MLGHAGVPRLPLRQATDLRRQGVQLVHGGLELRGGRLIVGLRLFRVERLQVFDQIEEQPTQFLQRRQRGIGAGARLVRGPAAGELVQCRGQPRQAVLGIAAQFFGEHVALFGGLPGLFVGLFGVRRGVAILRQQRLQPAQTPLAGEHQVAEQFAPLRLVQLLPAGVVVRALRRLLRRREQSDHVLLPAVGEFDQPLGVREQFDGVAQRHQGGVLRRQRAGRIAAAKRSERFAHVGEAVVQHRRGLPDGRPGARLVVRFRRRFGGRQGHRLEDVEHAAGARRGVFLPVAQVLGGEPCGRGALQRSRVAEQRRQRGGVQDQFALVARHRVQHGNRIPQLLPGALQFGERRIDSPMGAFALQSPQSPAGVARRLAGTLQEAGDATEPVGAGLLFRGALLGGCLFDEQTLLGGQIDAVPHLRDQHSLPRGECLELGLETERFRARSLFGHRAEQLAELIPHAALIVDQPVQPALQLVAFVHLIGELPNAPRDQLQIDAGVVVARRSEAHRVVEPRRALAKEVDHLRGGRLLVLVAFVRWRRGVVGRGEVRLRGQRQPQIERGAVAQLGIGPGLVPGGEKRLGRRVRIAGRQLFEPQVVLAAGRERGGFFGRGGVWPGRRGLALGLLRLLLGFGCRLRRAPRGRHQQHETAEDARVHAVSSARRGRPGELAPMAATRHAQAASTSQK